MPSILGLLVRGQIAHVVYPRTPWLEMYNSNTVTWAKPSELKNYQMCKIARSSEFCCMNVCVHCPHYIGGVYKHLVCGDSGHSIGLQSKYYIHRSALSLIHI